MMLSHRSTRFERISKQPIDVPPARRLSYSSSICMMLQFSGARGCMALTRVGAGIICSATVAMSGLGVSTRSTGQGVSYRLSARRNERCHTTSPNGSPCLRATLVNGAMKERRPCGRRSPIIEGHRNQSLHNITTTGMLNIGGDRSGNVGRARTRLGFFRLPRISTKSIGCRAAIARRETV